MTLLRPTRFAGIQVRIEPGATPDYFFSAVEDDLARIASGDIGSDLLDLIDKRSRGIGNSYARIPAKPNVTVCHAPGVAETTAKTQAATAYRTERTGKFGTTKRRFRPAGAGQSMWVFYHPNPPGTAQGDAIYAAAQGIRTPAFIALAHELIHAWHGLSGVAETREKHTIATPGNPPYQLSREEAFTVGLGPYANTRISENAIRAEHRLPRRTHYATQNDFAAIAGLPYRPGHRPTGQELSQHSAVAVNLDTEDWW